MNEMNDKEERSELTLNEAGGRRVVLMVTEDSTYFLRKWRRPSSGGPQGWSRSSKFQVTVSL
jgi:hypothetical protein